MESRDGTTGLCDRIVVSHLGATDGSQRAPAVKQDASEPAGPSLHVQSKQQQRRTMLWRDQVAALVNLGKLKPQVSACPYTPHSTLARYSSLDRASYASPPAAFGDLALTDGRLCATALAPAGVQQPAEMSKGDTMTARAPHSAAAGVSRIAPPAKRTASRSVDLKPQGKKQRRNYGGYALSADQVEELMDQDHKARPPILDPVAMAQAECGGWIFKETFKTIRSPDPRADKWKRGGGAGGATDLPFSQEPRVRRRYGYVISRGDSGTGSSRLRYHQYCRLISAKVDGDQSGSSKKFVEDSHIWLYHVLPQDGVPPPVRAPESPSVTPTHALSSQGSTGLASTVAGGTPAPLASLGIAKELLAAFDGDFSKAVECLLTAHRFP